MNIEISLILMAIVFSSSTVIGNVETDNISNIRVFNGNENETAVSIKLGDLEVFNSTIDSHKVTQYININSGSFIITLNFYQTEINFANKTGYTFYLYHSKVIWSEDKYSFTSDFKSFEESMVRAIHIGNRTDNLNMYRTITNCYHCFPDLFIENVDDKISDYKEIKRDYDSIFTVNGTNDSTTTQIGFDEYGIYTLLVFDDLSVLSIIDSKGHSTLPPFFITVGMCILFFIIWSWGIWFYEKRKEKKNDGYNQLLDIKKTIKKERMISLDIFRGISLAVMIFANYGSGGYSWFLHADWDGLTCADFVFPWFMWISGASLFLSFHAIKMHGNGWNMTLKMLWKITKRAISLELLGIFLNNASNLKHARISGVLQYFAIIGFINGLILLFVPLFDWKNKKFIKKWDERFIEIDKYFFSHIFEWMVMLIFPVVYLLVERLTTVPGCPRGYVGPGGIGDWGLYPDCTGGIHTYIDKKIFTLDHMYSGTKPVYRTGQYDPEGILGGVNAIFLCSLGVVCIQIYHCFSSLHSRIIYNTLMGLIFCGIAGGLCGFSQHDGIIPINKNLCSTSFVFLMSGTGTLLLLIFHILSDVFHLYSGFPFLAVGMNSIILYAGHEVFAGYFPFTFDSEVYDHWYCMESGILGTTMWIIIAQYWKHIGFFVKI